MNEERPIDTRVIYRQIDLDNMSPEIKEKYELAKKICAESWRRDMSSESDEQQINPYALGAKIQAFYGVMRNDQDQLYRDKALLDKIPKHELEDFQKDEYVGIESGLEILNDLVCTYDRLFDGIIET